MKMDLYKPYDIGMTEEYHYLNISQEKIKWLEGNGVSKDDLRYVYAQAELEAAKEAIQAGEKDIKIMNEYVKN